MVISESRLDFLNAIHSMSLLNFSVLLSETSQTEFFVMSSIDKLEKLHNSYNSIPNVAEIAENLHVSSPAVSRTITTLENKGYVERYTDKLNRRCTGVRLTPLGESVYEKEWTCLHDFTSTVLAKMGEEKVRNLISLSNELLVTVGQEMKTARAK